MNKKHLQHTDYTVAWVCALPIERAAAEAMLDRNHTALPPPSTDQNSYTLGSIAGHNIVIVGLPSGGYGISPATAAISNLRTTFPKVQYGFMVGIGGGAPLLSKGADVRLGDVVVSRPTGRFPGVVQYDFGKAMQGGKFENIGVLNKPPVFLLNAIGRLEARYDKGEGEISTILTNAAAKNPGMKTYFESPGIHKDWLFQSSYGHVDRSNDTAQENSYCDACDEKMMVTRPSRPSAQPCIHYGLIASANQVMKDATRRDQIVEQTGALCFEMEAAGLMDQLPSLVIRGICDYSDSHKNKEWQRYAAGVAAAYAKELLNSIPSPSVESKTSSVISRSLEEKNCLRKLFLTDEREHMNAMKRRKGDRVLGTCDWILETDKFQIWLGEKSDPPDNGSPNILWLHSSPGTGKSMVAITIAEELPKAPSFYLSNKTFLYFFCDATSDQHRTATALLRTIIHQLVVTHASLLRQLVQLHSERDNLFDSFDSLWFIFTELADDPDTGDKYVMIDGLDECDEESQYTLLTQINRFLNDGNGQKRNIHFLVISRYYPNIREELHMFPNVSLSSFHRASEDIRIFIEEKVQELQTKKRYSDTLTKKVSEILADKADGTYVWIGVACVELMSLPSRDALKTLNRLPKGLHSMYQALLEHTLQSDPELANNIKTILEAILVADGDLFIFDVAKACGLYENDVKDDRIEFTRDDIESCRLLKLKDNSSQVFKTSSDPNEKVHFIHKSAHDFLLDPGNQSNFSFNKKEAHAKLCYKAIEYLMAVSPRIYEVDTFYDYCSQNWAGHIHAADDHFEVKAEYRAFFDIQSVPRERSLLRHEIADPMNHVGRGELSIFHICAMHGLLSVAKYILPPGAVYRDSDFSSSFGGTPLQLAARKKHIPLIDMFLSHMSKDPLVWPMEIMESVAKMGGGDVAKLMISHYGPDLRFSKHFIISAMRHHWFDKKVLRMWFDSYHLPPMAPDVLRVAAMHHHELPGLLDLLLKELGPETRVPRGTWLAAAMSPDPRTIDVLLKREQCPVEIRPRVIEAATGHLEVLELVLKSVDYVFEVTEDLLIAATANKQQAHQVVDLLLEHPECSGCITERVLCAAARNSEDVEELMKRLLARHIDPPPPALGIIHSLASNKFCETETFERILQQFGHFVVSEEMIQCAIPSESMVQTLVDRFLKAAGGNTVDITDSIRQVIVAYCDARTVKSLHWDDPQKAPITAEILIAAFHSTKEGTLQYLAQYTTPEVMAEVIVQIPSNHLPGVEFIREYIMGIIKTSDSPSEAILKAALKVCFDHPVWDAFFEGMYGKIGAAGQYMSTMFPILGPAEHFEQMYEKGSKICITPNVLAMVFRWLDTSKEVFEWLLEQAGDVSKELEALLVAAASNYLCIWPMIIIFETHRGGIHITEDVMVAVAENDMQGDRLLALLEDHSQQPLPLTQRVVQAAAATIPWNRVFYTLLKAPSVVSLITEEFVYLLEQEHPSALQLLFTVHSDILPITKALLHAVSDCNKTDSVLILIRGASDEVLNSLDDDSMLRLARNGHAEALQFLRDHRAISVNCEWISAAEVRKSIWRNAYIDISSLLFDGAPPDVPDSNGYTPLCYAVGKGMWAAVRDLLRTGHVEVKMEVSSTGHTQLTLAILNQQHECVRMLLEAGATSRKGEKGRYSAYAIARWARDRYLVHLLEKYGQTDVWECPEDEEWKKHFPGPTFVFRPEI